MFLRRLKVCPTEQIKPSIECTATGPTNTYVWCGLSTGEVQLVNLDTGELAKRFELHKQIVTCLLLVEPAMMWSGSFDKTIKVTECRSKRVKKTLVGHQDAITCLTYGDDGTVYSGSLDGELYRWDIGNYECLAGKEGPLRSAYSGKILPVYSLSIMDELLIIGTGRSIVFLNKETRKQLRRLPAQSHVDRPLEPADEALPNQKPDGRRNLWPSDDPGSGGAAAGWGGGLRQQRSMTLPANMSRPTKSIRSQVRLADDLKLLSNPAAQASPRTMGELRPNVPPFRQGLAGAAGGPSASPGKHPNKFKPLEPPPSLRFGNNIISPRRKFLPAPVLVANSDEPDAGSPVRRTSSGSSFARPAAGDDQRSGSPFAGRQSALALRRRTSLGQQTSQGQRPGQLQGQLGFGSGQLRRDSAPDASLATAGDKDPLAPTEAAAWGGGGAAAAASPPKTAYLGGGTGLFMAAERRDQPTRPSFPRGEAASHCVLLGPPDELWSCSEKFGVVQVWSLVTHTLIQHWDLDLCHGLNHLVYSRGCVWGAGTNGSIYIFDAAAKQPLTELRVHTDSVRHLCVVSKERVVSCSASKDTTLAEMANLPSGRHGRGLFSQPDDASFASYDRYGFLQLGPGAPDLEPPAEHQELVASLPDELRSRHERRKRVLLAQTEAWDQYLERNPELFGNDNGAGVSDYVALEDSREVHRLIRAGVPDKFRQVVWTGLVNRWIGPQRRSLGPDYYSHISDDKNFDFPAPPESLVKQVQLDLHRTFPTNRFFEETGTAINKLRRVLYGLMRHLPHVGYCQGFNFIAGFALLFLSEEMAFWCVVTLIGTIMPDGYFTDPMTASRADQPILRDIVMNHIPQLSEVLEIHQFDLSLVTFNWFFTLFVEATPTDVTLRVWDLLLSVGDRALYGLSYSILEFHADKATNIEDPGDLFDMMRGLGRMVADPDELHYLTSDELPFTWQYVEEQRVIRMAELRNADKEVLEQVAAMKLKKLAMRAAKAKAAAAQTAADVEPSGALGVGASRAAEILSDLTPAVELTIPDRSMSNMTPRADLLVDLPSDRQPISNNGISTIISLEEASTNGSEEGDTAVTAEAKTRVPEPDMLHPVGDALHSDALEFGDFVRDSLLDDQHDPRPLSTHSQDSWIQVEYEDATTMPFKVKHSKDWTTTPEQVGGTWDGRLLPSAADGSLSLSKFLKARLPSRQGRAPRPRVKRLNSDYDGYSSSSSQPRSRAGSSSSQSRSRASSADEKPGRSRALNSSKKSSNPGNAAEGSSNSGGAGAGINKPAQERKTARFARVGEHYGSLSGKPVLSEARDINSGKSSWPSDDGTSDDDGVMFHE